MQRMNLNQYATIFLTEKGLEYVHGILSKKYDKQKIKTIILHDFPYIKLRLQMWEIMASFPDMFYNGSDLIESSIIELEELK